MKTSSALSPLVLSTVIGLLGNLAFAAAPEIKVTSTVYPDKSRTDMQSNLAEGTAEAKTYDAAGKLTQRMTYKLDEKGQPTEGVAYSEKGAALFKFEYTRDASGRISEERDSTASGTLLRRLVYRFGTDGKVSGIDAYDAEGRPLSAASGPKKKTSTRRSK